MKRKSPRQWRKEEIELARFMNQQGCEVRAVAHELGCSNHQASRLMIKNGIRVRSRVPFTTAQRKKLLALVERKMADWEIAKRLGCKVGKVRSYRRRNGIKPGITNSETGKRGAIKAKYLFPGGLPFHRVYERHRIEAIKAGWPAGTTAAQHRILDKLKERDWVSSKQLLEIMNLRSITTLRRVMCEMARLGWVQVKVVRLLKHYRVDWEGIKEHKNSINRAANGHKYRDKYEKSEDFVDDWHEAG